MPWLIISEAGPQRILAFHYVEDSIRPWFVEAKNRDGASTSLISINATN